MQEASIKKRVLVPLTLGLCFLLIVFLAVLFWVQKSDINQRVDRQFKAAEFFFKSQQEYDANLLSSLLDTIINDRAILQALETKNRKALLLHTGPLFKKISSQHPISHLYFHDARRINLLLVHLPNRFGDRIDRFTTLKAEKTNRVAYGLELGPMGTLTLRVVAPVVNKNRRIGFIELGEEINHLNSKLKKNLGIELIVYQFTVKVVDFFP